MSESTASDDAPRHLSGRSFTVCLLILLMIFVFLNPIWQTDRMDAWNENIWWSYAPIPLLVAVFLRAEGKWSGGAFLLDTMKLTIVKFVLTFLAANALWAFWGPPGLGPERPAPPAARAAAPTFEPHPAPTASELDPATLGGLVGVVRDAQGRPVRGALVWIAAGLEQHVFAPAPERLSLIHRGQGFEPSLAALPIHGTLSLRSEDPELHTLVVTDGQRQRLINYPVLQDRERELMFSRAHGPLELTCSVHGEEPRSLLVVTGNPFHTRSDEQGRFSLVGVPAGELVLSAATLEGGAGRARVALLAGQTASLAIHLRGTPIR